jgi:hypothetical protein
VKKNKKALKVGTAEPFKMDFHWAPEPAWHPGEFDYYARGAMERLIEKMPVQLTNDGAIHLRKMIAKGAAAMALLMMAEKREAFLPAPKPQDEIALAK